MSSRDRAILRDLALADPEAIKRHYQSKGRAVPKWVEQTIIRRNNLQPPIKDLELLLANLEKFEAMGFGLMAKYGNTAKTLLVASSAASGDDPGLEKYLGLIWQKTIHLIYQVQEDIKAINDSQSSSLELEFDFTAENQD